VKGLSKSFFVTFVVFVLFVPFVGFVASQTPPPRVLASVESRWENAYCDLTELARVGTGELMVRYRYRNTRKTTLSLPHRNLVPDTRVLDPVSMTLLGVLKDTDGKPVSSTMIEVTAARPVPAGGTQLHWARLQAPPEAVKSVTALVQGCLPFEDVAIQGTPSVSPQSTPTPVIASQDGEADGLVVEITSLNRTPGRVVTATFRYRNKGPRVFRFPPAPRVRAAYLLDSENRRKHEVSRDAQQQPVCSETLELVGTVGESLAPGQAITLWAKFAAPPESTKTASVSLPFAPPFSDVPISGTGSAAAGAGSAIAGVVLGLDAALKELDAKVTDTEIRFELAADVLFDFDKAEIQKEAEPSLRNVATVLKANPGAKVAIEGHTDGRGADAYNQKLSEARAASVKQWLVTNAQVNGATITTRGWGKTKPVTHNTKPDGSDDPEGRAKNRRVEIVVTKGA